VLEFVDVAVSEDGEDVLRRPLPQPLPAEHVVRQVAAHVGQSRVFVLVEIPRLRLQVLLVFLILPLLREEVDAASPDGHQRIDDPLEAARGPVAAPLVGLHVDSGIASFLRPIGRSSDA